MTPPTVCALLTCSAVLQDDTSQRVTLYGTCAGYAARRYPAAMPPLCVYVAITDGRGTVPLTVRLVDGADETVLYSRDLPRATFRSPLETKELAIEVPNLTLPAPGTYRWQVLCGAEVIHERRFVAEER